MSTAAGRPNHAKAILGPELHARLSETKVLLVGAGGIGCELLKNVVLTGFGKITLLDLDTIDLSNLNRQFLFRKKDVKQSKALIAAQTAAPFNPNVQIMPIHGNIKEPQYDIEWFQGFDLVLNALDNLDARRHVNKMCMAAQVPLVESGTAGYLGQVQPLVKDLTECFDCIPKPTPKTFPVCTIRSTPSQPIHCIVWSKSYLMGQFFGQDEDATGELDEAERQGENAEEIATLRREAQSFNAVRTAIRDPNNDGSAAKQAFQKVFDNDIRNLLSMSDMWRHRDPPTPLDYDAIMNESFVGARSTAPPQVNGAVNTNGKPNGENSVQPAASTSAAGPKIALKDQRKLTLKENLELFVSSVNHLSARLAGGQVDMIEFDKDDDDTLDFVTASSNLRSIAYGIEEKTRWEVKEMAGNIIPAIATTNAIISGLIVLQALHLLRKSYDKLRNVHLQFKPTVPLSTITLSKPNPDCGICRDTYTKVQCDPSRTTLEEVVKGLLGDDAREVSVFEDKRVLADPDFDENYEKTLESMSVTRGKFLSIADEDGEWSTITVAIADLPLTHPSSGPSLILPDPLPRPTKKAKPQIVAPSTPPRASLKRSAPDDDIVLLDHEPMDNGQPAAKKQKLSQPELSSPSKKRKLEEDGIVLLEGADDKMDDDVIVID